MLLLYLFPKISLLPSLRARYTTVDRVTNSKLKSALCKKLVSSLIDSLAFLGLVSSELNQFRREHLKSSLPKKIKPLAKNVPAKSKWLFGDDLNKIIIQLAVKILHSLLIFANIISMVSIRVTKQVLINTSTVQKTPKLPRRVFLKGNSKYVVHSNFVGGYIKTLMNTGRNLQMMIVL